MNTDSEPDRRRLSGDPLGKRALFAPPIETDDRPRRQRTGRRKDVIYYNWSGTPVGDATELASLASDLGGPRDAAQVQAE